MPHFRPQKNPLIAGILGLTLGPLGLLYVGWKPALAMFALTAPVALVTRGYGLFVTEPICAAVGYLAVVVVVIEEMGQGRE